MTDDFGTDPPAPRAPRRPHPPAGRIHLPQLQGFLELSFAWFNDRFAHQLRWHADGALPQRLLWSVEGSPDDVWPPSPPLQDCRFANGRDESAGFLATGMAGRSFWSVAVGPVAGVGWTFDWSCRSADPEGPLGTTYATSGPVHRLDRERLLLPQGPIPLELRSSSGALATDWIVPEPDAAAENRPAHLGGEQGFRLRARPLRQEAGLGTMRWGYTVAAPLRHAASP